MAFDLEGDLQIERAHTRRWVAIIAVVQGLGTRLNTTFGSVQTALK